MEYPYKIPYNKIRMSLLLIGSFLFLLLSIWLMTVPDNPFGLYGEPVMISIGAIGALFTGLGSIIITRMLLSGKLAIEVNDEGIRDETSGVSIGLIRWKDIESIEPYRLLGNDFILINVSNPEYYYERARGSLARQAMERNEHLTGTPVQLNCNSVAVPTEQLLELLRAELTFQRELEEGPGLSLAELIRQRNKLFG